MVSALVMQLLHSTINESVFKEFTVLRNNILLNQPLAVESSKSTKPKTKANSSKSVEQQQMQQEDEEDQTNANTTEKVFQATVTKLSKAYENACKVAKEFMMIFIKRLEMFFFFEIFLFFFLFFLFN